MTHNPDIPFAKSLVDYIFRWMGMEFIPGYRAANAPQRAKKAEPKEDAGTPAVREKIASIIEPAKKQSDDEAPAAKSNGNGNGHGNRLSNVDAPRRSTTIAQVSVESSETRSETSSDGTVHKTTSVLSMAMKEMQADAPACDICGTITVRSGTCYKCNNCGNSMGCS
jgi:ribonucleoside-diphosphate reductase alpha chain